MERRCNICGAKITLPSKAEGNIKEVKCPECGAIALLKVRRRNRNVKGLKQGFVNVNNLYIHLREK